MENKMKNTLSNRALLVHVRLSQWTARKRDLKATETVHASYLSDRSSGAYTKKLLPGAVELDVVSALSGQIRKYFYEQTLPWFADGSRIISVKNHLKFARQMRSLKSDYETACSDFLLAYPRLKMNARRKLANLYNEAEYPSIEDLREKFNCEISYLPMPDAEDFRVSVSDAEKREFIRKMNEVESTAMREAWQRLYDVAQKTVEKLKDPDAIFRDSLIKNVESICELLPSLNITEDKNLEESRKEISKLVKGYSSDVLRENKEERKKAYEKLSEITDKMGAFMGKA